MLKVAKFGGSSVADTNQFKKVKEIINEDVQRRYIVVSAMGKSKKYPEKITDLLIQLYQQPDNFSLFNRIKNRFLEIKQKLALSYNIEKEFERLQIQLKEGVSYDYLISRGEYFTAQLMAEYLDFPFLDAKDVIVFENDEHIDFNKTGKNIKKFSKEFECFIIPGFYGTNNQNEIQLMKRGGSDISGALLASFLNAGLYENWTDVSGFYMVDPHLIQNPKKIKRISYTELKELSHRGANVLHEEAIFPVKEKNIPIQILNTNSPKESGTRIENYPISKHLCEVSGIAGNKDYSIIRIFKKENENNMDVLHDSLEILKKYKIKIENIPAEINNCSIVIGSKNKEESIKEAIQEIYDSCLVDKIKLVNDVALISVVGQNLVNHSKIIGSIFYGLGNEDIDVKIISKGNEDMSLLIGIDSCLLNKAVESIYKTLS